MKPGRTNISKVTSLRAKAAMCLDVYFLKDGRLAFKHSNLNKNCVRGGASCMVVEATRNLRGLFSIFQHKNTQAQ